MHTAIFFLRLGTILAGISVACGAFAAHFLDKQFAEQYEGFYRVVAGVNTPLAVKYLGDFKTGAEYQMTHSLALIAVGLLMLHRLRAGDGPCRILTAAGWCFAAGIVLFSGMLYVLTLLNMRPLGAVVPIGGVLMIAGWGLFAWSVGKMWRGGFSPVG